MTALGKIKAAILSYPGNYPVTVRFLTNGGVTQLANQRLTQSQTLASGGDAGQAPQISPNR
jgi:hypothetical protein